MPPAKEHSPLTIFEELKAKHEQGHFQADKRGNHFAHASNGRKYYAAYYEGGLYFTVYRPK
ncbi:hypothetical protein D3C85_765730 [compost metagenome]